MNIEVKLKMMNVEYFAHVIGSTIGILLLVLTYSYINKLEKIGCDCAVHKDRSFIKNYCVFAISYLLITMFFPPVEADALFGSTVGGLYMLLNIVFVIVTIVFYIKSLTYVRYLMKEKCKCSEDVRREILYVWSILEIIILIALVVIPLVFAIAAGAYAFTKTSLGEIRNSKDTVLTAVVDPIRSIRKVPEALRKSMKSRK